MHIEVVADEACPGCGQVGRPKVGDEDGTWSWKCFTEGCKIGYYNPTTGKTERRIEGDELAELQARIKAEVEESLKGRVWICRSTRPGMSTSKTIPEGDPVPDGWHLTGPENCADH